MERSSAFHLLIAAFAIFAFVLSPSCSDKGGDDAAPGSTDTTDTESQGADDKTDTEDGPDNTDTSSPDSGDKDTNSSTDEFESCTETSAVAIMEQAKTNLIIAVDTSGSMRKETEMVQENINNRFAEKFGAHADIDVHIILLSEPCSDPASGDDGMCVSKPLGSGDCPEDSNPAKLFWHIPQRVSSHDSLQRFVECRGDNGDECQGERWKDYASPDGFVHFVVVSDDDSNMTADEFETWADGLFGKNWMFHGIVAKTDDNADGASEECQEYAANEGAVYKELISRTGGVFGDLCLQENNEFDVVFDQITTEVITHVEMPCAWKIPAPPEGDELDPTKVNVDFTDGKTNLSIGKVGSPSDCDKVEHGWYYDDNSAPGEIRVCPQTCEWIQGRPEAEMLIKFGCKTRDAGPV